MAATYKYQDVFNLVRGQFSLGEEDLKAVAICNMANERIWNYAAFKQTLATLRPFCLIPSKQVYGPPQVAVPSDFAGFHQAFLTRTSTFPPEQFELSTRRDLRRTHIRDFPNYIGYDSATASFIFDRPSPSNIGGHEWIVTGDYKKTPTKVTAALAGSTVLPWDDRHLANVVQVFQWAAAVAVGNPKAPQLQQVADYAISTIARDEGFELGDPTVAPSMPLVGYQYGNALIYPFGGGW